MSLTPQLSEGYYEDVTTPAFFIFLKLRGSCDSSYMNLRFGSGITPMQYAWGAYPTWYYRYSYILGADLSDPHPQLEYYAIYVLVSD